MQNNKTFCIAPWVQAVVRNSGIINPCCSIESTIFKTKETSILEYYNSDVIKDMKQKMLTGERITACEVCYHNEKTVGRSQRLEFNEDYKFYHEKFYNKLLEHLEYDKLDFPQRIELHVGNACNLKCLTCRPQDSSAMLTEENILKISIHDQREFNTNKKMLVEIKKAIGLDKIKVLDLRGGETMLEPNIKTFLLALDYEKTLNIDLRLQTNGTIFNNDWKEIFNKFKSIDLMLSVDAYGDDNHYIRYPSNWKDISQNVKEFQTNKKVSNFYVNVTVSNLNVTRLPKLFDWLIEKNIPVQLHVLSDPKIYTLDNLPRPIIEETVKQLEIYLDSFKFERSNNQLAGVINHIKNILSERETTLTSHWKDFCEMIDKRDNHRQNRIFDILPELKEYWINA